MKVKEESEKVGLKLNIQTTKILASVLITSWQIGCETGNCGRLYFGGSKITADGDCSHEINKHLLFGKDPDTGRDWGQEEKRTTEDEMTEWHHRLTEHVFE